MNLAQGVSRNFQQGLDYEVGLLESGLKFNNPNVVEACGCGESIKFDSVEDMTPPADGIPRL